jgi:hypothetical protein
MRQHSAVTSVSWIPSEAVRGLSTPVFDVGTTRYDDPLPDALGDLEAWQQADLFRFANRLSAWIDVEDGQVVDAGYDGGGMMGTTTVQVAGVGASFTAAALDDLRQPIEAGPTWARFVQTTGGRTGLPAPRAVTRPPFVRLLAPAVWTTLALTIHVDGRSEFRLVGASPFPRHWIYDANGRLAAKVGMTDFTGWFHGTAPRHTPWGDEETPALVTAVETALERELASLLMRGGSKPEVREVPQGTVLTRQEAEGDEIYVLLDGVLSVEVDGSPLAELGPGAILGERSVLEGGRRTSTLRAVTPGRVAVATPDQIDLDALARVSEGHRREAQPPD